MVKLKTGKKEGNQKIAHESLKVFHILSNATNLFHHSLKEAAQQIHGEGELSDPRRSILMSLHRFGSRTVPKMAHERKVSRQNIQKIVNVLLENKLVEFSDNPDHKRSRLIELTKKGHNLVETMNQNEAKIMTQAKLDVSNKDMLDAAKVLSSISEGLKRILIKLE